MFLEHSAQSITVIITNHQYDHLIDTAIRSVLQQLLLPSAILIIDDAPRTNAVETLVSSYNNQLLQYHRVSYLDPLKSREHGFKLADSDFVCFLDADDYLSENYLERASDLLDNNDVIYSNIQYFGDRSDRTDFNIRNPAKQIHISNFLHVGCLIRKNVLIASDAFNLSYTRTDFHEDWMFWRKVLSLPNCKVAKQTGLYFAGIHPDNRSNNVRKDYFDQKGGEFCDLTIAIINSKDNQRFKVESDEYVQHLIANDLLHFIIFDNKLHVYNYYHRLIFSHFKYTNTINMLNLLSRMVVTEYLYIYDENLVEEDDISILNDLSLIDDKNIAVHDSKYPMFSNTLITSSVFKSYYYYDINKLPFNDREKVLYK